MFWGLNLSSIPNSLIFFLPLFPCPSYFKPINQVAKTAQCTASLSSLWSLFQCITLFEHALSFLLSWQHSLTSCLQPWCIIETGNKLLSNDLSQLSLLPEIEMLICHCTHRLEIKYSSLFSLSIGVKECSYNAFSSLVNFFFPPNISLINKSKEAGKHLKEDLTLFFHLQTRDRFETPPYLTFPYVRDHRNNGHYWTFSYWQVLAKVFSSMFTFYPFTPDGLRLNLQACLWVCVLQLVCNSWYCFCFMAHPGNSPEPGIEGQTITHESINLAILIY